MSAEDDDDKPRCGYPTRARQARGDFEPHPCRTTVAKDGQLCWNHSQEAREQAWPRLHQPPTIYLDDPRWSHDCDDDWVRFDEAFTCVTIDNAIARGFEQCRRLLVHPGTDSDNPHIEIILHPAAVAQMVKQLGGGTTA